MKKLPAYIMVIALLVMNIPLLHHADECIEAGNCDPMHLSGYMDMDHHNNSDQGSNGQESADCDCCSNGHHHSHASIATGKAEHFMVSSKTLHSSAGDTYFSQLSYPPSKPPKA